jgi:hypothetical protein
MNTSPAAYEHLVADRGVFGGSDQEFDRSLSAKSDISFIGMEVYC